MEIDNQNLIEQIPEYSDTLHGEALEGIQVAENGYKYRILDGVIMPPYITPARYELSRRIKTVKGDICFISYPKSGSTWLSYILLLLTNEGEIPSEKTLRNCLHWVANSWIYPRTEKELDSLPAPRIFKSHMSYQMAVGGNPRENPCKYIYIARNPKDVAVSYYYFETNKAWSGNFDATWEHWLQMFIEGKVQRGDWFDHVLSWWENRDADNIIFIKYEDLKRNFGAELTKIAEFLNYPLTNQLLKIIEEQTAFKKMKKNEFSNLQDIGGIGNFFRKGEIGSWKDVFTVAQNEQFDQLYQKRIKDSGLTFDFE